MVPSGSGAGRAPLAYYDEPVSAQRGDHPGASHSAVPGGAGGWPAPALLLAGVQAPRPHRQVAARATRQAEQGRIARCATPQSAV